MCFQWTIRKRTRLVAQLLAAATLMSALSGCHTIPVLPGREPFGEQTASDDQAESVWKSFAESFREERFEDWDGCTISWSEGSQEVDVYRTEEYTLAYCGDRKGGDYLWYDGWLYWKHGDSMAYREMAWEELQVEQMAAELWTMAQSMLEQTPTDLTYKYIPMSKDKRNLLTAEFELGENQVGDYASISTAIKSHGQYDSISFQWQDVGDLEKGVGVDNIVVSISFYPIQDTTDLQAERKLWSFGYDCGLLERGVPALSTQDEDREGCREVISSIDWVSLRNRIPEQKDLVFPGFQDRNFERESES